MKTKTELVHGIRISPTATSTYKWGLSAPSGQCWVAGNWFKARHELLAYAKAAGWLEFAVTRVEKYQREASWTPRSEPQS